MKNREILYTAAMLAGKEDAAKLLSDGVPDSPASAENDVAFMRSALHYGLSEIADRRAAPVAEETLQSSGFILYSALRDHPVKLLTVDGKEIRERRADGFFAPKGTVTVRYERRPKEGELDDEADIAPEIPPEAAVCFVAAECASKSGLSERQRLFLERYERLLKTGIKSKKKLGLPAGRWRI